MNYNEYRLMEIREAITILDGRKDTEELVEQLREERRQILDRIGDK